MKQLSLLLLFAAGVFIAKAQTDKEPYLVKSLTNESIREVEARTSGGSISVSGGASNSRIEVYVQGNNGKSLSKDEIKQRLDELYNLDVSVSGGKLSAIAKSKENIRDWKKALSIAFKIYVSSNVSTELSTSGGSIHLDNLSGSQKFSTSGGSLHLAKLSGKIDGTTSGGSIHLEDSKDNIDLRTSGGSIEASNCSGNLRLATSGGSLDLSNLKGSIRATTSGGSVKGESIDGELEAHTSGGNVDLDNLTCSLETSTSGGNIDVSFASLGKYVKIGNSAGSVRLTLPKGKGLDLDLSGDIANTSFENFSGRIDDRSVRGKLNGGGVPVTVDANSGRIRLELK